MFTRCPQCGTVFRITATQLRIAGGDVRCGSCARVFNALGQLSDEPPGMPDRAPARPPGDEPDLAQEFSGPVDDEAAMEFDAPEPTWSQYFIGPKPPPGAEAPDGTPRADVALDGELESITADPDEWRAFLEEMETAQEGANPWGSEEIAAEVDELGREAPVYVVDEAPGDAARMRAEAGAAGHDDQAPPPTDPADQSPPGTAFEDWHVTPGEQSVPAAFGDDLAEPEEDEPQTLAPWTYADAESPDGSYPARSGLWALGSLLLTVLLIMQLLHVSRDDLASHPRYGATVRDVYARLGRELFPSWPIGAYVVRRAEALAGGSADDALDISAAIETQGKAPLGLPLVRVALRDQWANVVASRVFTPEQYLPEAMPAVVPGGTRIPVRLSVADPGTQARGFEVDLCLPRRQGLECQLARDPFAQ